MNRQELLVRINTFIGRFTQEVKQFNEAGHYDINVHSENVLIPLLKETFDYQGLQNANAISKNTEAIDLIDYQNRVCIQVTATSDAKKISDTLVKFFKNNQQRAFDRIIFYIITERQKSYKKPFKDLLLNGFDFNPERDVIDNAGLYDTINASVLNLQKLVKIERLLADEFSELRIQERSLKTSYNIKNSEGADTIHPNLIRLLPPQNLYQADLNFDFDAKKESLIKYLKDTKQFWKIRHVSGKDIVNHSLGSFEDNYSFDFVLRNKKVLTFRNLFSSTDPLRKIIDAGTITTLSIDEYINDDEDRLNILKDLLNSVLRGAFIKRDIEWVDTENKYRFKIGKALNARKVSYKNKSGRGVVFDVLSKENQKKTKDELGRVRTEKGKHIVCFRHLAFELNVHQFSDNWFVSIKPDWSFTSAMNGKRQSRYSQYYMKGIKEMEWNDSIFDQFQFLSDYLISFFEGDIFQDSEIKLLKMPEQFKTSPPINDAVWNQAEPKSKETKGQYKILFGE